MPSSRLTAAGVCCKLWPCCALWALRAAAAVAVVDGHACASAVQSVTVDRDVQAYPDPNPIVALHIPETQFVTSPSGSYHTTWVACAAACSVGECVLAPTIAVWHVTGVSVRPLRVNVAVGRRDRWLLTCESAHLRSKASLLPSPSLSLLSVFVILFSSAAASRRRSHSRRRAAVRYCGLLWGEGVGRCPMSLSSRSVLGADL